MSAATPAPDAPVILFDGVCNLCNSSVRWIIRRDRRRVFRFAPLQSEVGRAALAGAGAPHELPDSMVLIDGGRVFTRSQAVIKISERLGLPWSLARVGLLLPRVVRDGLYTWIARNRHRWFGKQTACMAPTQTLRHRFLDFDEPAIGLPRPDVARERQELDPEA